MRNDVFIAYSRKDTHAAESIENRLQKSGLRCYRDVKSIPGSKKWIDEITEAIKSCHIVIAIVSENSAFSEHVDSELQIAFNAKKTFLPIVLSDDVHLSNTMEYVFGKRQFTYAKPSLEAVLPSIEEFVWDVVDPLQHKGAYDDIGDVQNRSNYHKEVKFAEDRYGLLIGDFPCGTTRIENSAYVMIAKPKDYLGFEMSGLPRMAEFVLEASISKQSGHDDHWFGFEFGERFPGNYYQFLLNGKGTIRLSKYWHKEWHDLICLHNMHHIRGGNLENTLKVIRKGTTFHVFVNGRYTVTVHDSAVRAGKLGTVVGWGIQAAFADVYIDCIDLKALFTKALNLWKELKILESQKDFKYIVDYDPYGYAEYERNSYHLLAEIRPDYRKTILIVIGYQVLPQIHDGLPAVKLKKEINRRGNQENLEFASVVTDAGLIEERVFMSCPIITIGGHLGNKITADFMNQLPCDTVSSKGIKIQHNMEKEDRRVTLWGDSAEDTAKAVDIFISSGLLDRFLTMIWRREIHTQARSSCIINVSKSREIAPNQNESEDNVRKRSGEKEESVEEVINSMQPPVILESPNKVFGTGTNHKEADKYFPPPSRLLGNKCAVCYESVYVESDAVYCRNCDSILHRNCTDGTLCPNCLKNLHI